jgi:hypothetical protein
LLLLYFLIRSSELGIYDFFAYIVPGSFFLFTVVYFLVVVGLIQIDFQLLNSLSLTFIVAFSIAAFVTGLILDRFSRVWQDRLFRSKETPDAVFDDFKAAHNYLQFNFQGKEWPILLAFLRRDNPDLVVESIERHNATNIMLRNISLGLMVLTIVQVYRFVATNHYSIVVFCKSGIIIK